MANIVNISRRSARPEHVVQCLSALQQGTVVVPSECGRIRVTSAARQRNRTIDQPESVSDQWSFLVTGHNQVGDFLPDLLPPIRRVLRCGWPGPLVAEFPEATAGFPHLPFRESPTFFAPGHWFTRKVVMESAQPLEASFLDHKTYNASELRPAANEESLLWFDDRDTVHEPVVRLRIAGFEWKIIGETVESRKAVNVMSAKKYLFVCTGNTCRSPMAEGIFREMLAERLQCSADELEASGFMVLSAGLAAGRAHPASAESVDVMRLRGIDLDDHASQPLTQGLLEQADRVYTMTQYHRESILRARPDLAERIEVLSREGTDVTDPIGGSTDEYIQCCEEIERHLRVIAEGLDLSPIG